MSKVEAAKAEIEMALIKTLVAVGPYEYDLYLKFDGNGGYEELDQKCELPSFDRVSALRRPDDPDERLGLTLTERIKEIVEPLRAELPFGRLIVGMNGKMNISFGK